MEPKFWKWIGPEKNARGFVTKYIWVSNITSKSKRDWFPKPSTWEDQAFYFLFPLLWIETNKVPPFWTRSLCQETWLGSGSQLGKPPVARRLMVFSGSVSKFNTVVEKVRPLPDGNGCPAPIKTLLGQEKPKWKKCKGSSAAFFWGKGWVPMTIHKNESLIEACSVSKRKTHKRQWNREWPWFTGCHCIFVLLDLVDIPRYTNWEPPRQLRQILALFCDDFMAAHGMCKRPCFHFFPFWQKTHQLIDLLLRPRLCGVHVAKPRGNRRRTDCGLCGHGLARQSLQPSRDFWRSNGWFVWGMKRGWLFCWDQAVRSGDNLKSILFFSRNVSSQSVSSLFDSTISGSNGLARRTLEATSPMPRFRRPELSPK